MHLSDVKRDKNYGFREMMYDIDAVFIPRKMMPGGAVCQQLLPKLN